MKILLRSFAAIVVISLLIWYLPRLDFEAIKNALRLADRLFVSLGILLVILSWCVRSGLLWRILYQRIKISYPATLAINFIGAMLDMLIPGRSGVVARWGLLSLRAKDSKGFVASSLVTFLIIDAASLMIVFLVALFLSHDVQKVSNFWMNAILVIFILMIFTAIFAASRIEKFIKKFAFSKWTPVQTFLETLHKAKNPKTLTLWLCFGLINWLIQITSMQCFAWALGFELSLDHRVLLLMAINLAIVVPIVPGHVGTMQLVITSVLSQFGIAAEMAFAYSIIYHISQLIPVMGLGAISALFVPMKGLKASLKSNTDLG